MSEGLDRILDDKRDFSAAITRCKNVTFNSADVKDAYNRLSRLVDRYHHEKDNRTLDSGEEQALHKVFEDDVFIKGMLDGRQIGEHVVKREGRGQPVIYLKGNIPVPLVAQTSAGGLFAEPIYIVPDDQGTEVNHLDQLTEAEKRVEKAFTRATN